MKYRGIFEYEYPTEHKPPVSIDVHLHGDCVKGKIIEWEYRPLEQGPKTGHWIEGQTDNPNIHNILCSCCFEGYPSKGHANSQYTREKFKYCPNCGAKMVEPQESEE